MFSLAIHNRAKIISTNFRRSLYIAPAFLPQHCYPNAIFNFRNSQMQDKLESMLPLSLLISGCHTEECGTANWLIPIGKTQWWRECGGINYKAASCEPQLPLLLACGIIGWPSPLIFGNNKLFSGILRHWGFRPNTQHTQRSRERKG